MRNASGLPAERALNVRMKTIQNHEKAPSHASHAKAWAAWYCWQRTGPTPSHQKQKIPLAVREPAAESQNTHSIPNAASSNKGVALLAVTMPAIAVKIVTTEMKTPKPMAASMAPNHRAIMLARRLRTTSEQTMRYAIKAVLRVMRSAICAGYDVG